MSYALSTLLRKQNLRALCGIFLATPLAFPYGACAGQIAAGPDSSGPDPAAEGASVASDSAVASQLFDQADSPMRITLAHEASYKVEKPDYIVKNRSSARMEYSKYLLEHFFLQLDAKATAFLKEDHRHEAEGSDTTVSQAYIQTSFRQTSIKAGIQTLPWGESMLAPITDEVSPRDNRELFNFNLEELRIGQPMLAVDQYSGWGRWSVFLVPHASFNKNPEEGTAYFFDPFEYRSEIAGEDGSSEYGVSWRKTFASADITFMAASLIDNDYALRMDGDGLVTREKHRFSLAGAVFNYAMKEFVIRGEVAWKSSKAHNDAALQIVKKDAVDMYLAVEYAPSSTLTVSLEGINQHVVDWSTEIRGAPEDRRSLLLSVTKLLMHDDLSINFMNFYNTPNNSNLAMLLTTYDWNDNLTLGVNVIYPYTEDGRSSLWNVRDQKQVVFRIQYQF